MLNCNGKSDETLLWGEIEIADSFRYVLSPHLLELPLSAVPKIDCNNCRRVEEKTAIYGVFCCDVTPSLANFLVGEILTHGGNSVIDEWIEQCRGNPFGLWVPPLEAEKHRFARREGQYGQPCPLLTPIRGHCAIYARRPPLCIGYHCYYPNRMWRETWSCLVSTLDLLQDATSRYLVFQADFDFKWMADWWDREIEEIWQDNSYKPDCYAAYWQKWQSREQEFYRRCYETMRSGDAKLFADIRDHHRQHLSDRLDLQPAVDREQLDYLAWEYTNRHKLHLAPIEPSKSQRQRFVRGAICAEENTLSIHQQESILWWYLKQLTERSAKPWWHRLFGGG